MLDHIPLLLAPVALQELMVLAMKLQPEQLVKILVHFH
jgi:hypothetical protein